MSTTRKLPKTFRAARTSLGPRMAMIVATVCAAAMLVLAWQAWSRLNTIVAQRDQLQLARALTNSLVANVLTAESSQRGYLLTGDERFLVSYNAATARVAGETMHLHRIALPAIQHAAVMPRFYAQLTAKRKEMNLALSLARKNHARQAAKSVVGAEANPNQVSGFSVTAKQVSTLINALIFRKQRAFNHLLGVSALVLILCVLFSWFIFLLYAYQRRRVHETALYQRALLKRRSERWEVVAQGRANQLAALATYLQHVGENERARLARELHDELGSLMTAAKLELARVKSRVPDEADDLRTRLKHLNGILDNSIALERNIIENLRPSALTNLGLVPALEILADEWRASSGIETQSSFEEVAMDAARELTIYRLVQESLTNVGKHAAATHVKATLENFPDRAEITVTDDGTGFNAEHISRTSRGLAGMRHRLEACGGSLSVDSQPGHGTRLVGKIPRRAAPPDSPAV